MKHPARSKLVWLAFATSALGAAMEWLREWSDLIPYSPTILMILGALIAVFRMFTFVPLSCMDNERSD